MHKFMGFYRAYLFVAALWCSLGYSVVGKVAASQDAKEPGTRATPERSITGFEGIDQAQPLWELGLGGGVGEVPNYPASSERNFIALAAPYFVYRGEIFRVGDGNGVRAVVAEDDKWELDFSFGGAFSADSEDNTAREGMPELDFLFEVGPQLVYQVNKYRFEGGGQGRLNLRLQARSVFSTDLSSIQHQGYVFEPELQWQQRGYWREHTALSVRLSSTFATEKLHDYFYQVDQAFATDMRPEFNATAGYLGTELGVSLSFAISKNARGFIGGSLRLHHGAANEDSPLFEETNTLQLAAGFVWRLYTSKTKASY
ncbi:MipA/OmpV family protein [Agaribacter flavus]|uniref:MipA/OmpV family protein n=1 Tax=Agaribacter flavus TaxID=1902781 RepID=A0ABV7FRH0_9ALTE